MTYAPACRRTRRPYSTAAEPARIRPLYQVERSDGSLLLVEADGYAVGDERQLTFVRDRQLLATVHPLDWRRVWLVSG